jgi:hypothetical protein
LSPANVGQIPERSFCHFYTKLSSRKISQNPFQIKNCSGKIYFPEKNRFLQNGFYVYYFSADTALKVMLSFE